MEVELRRGSRRLGAWKLHPKSSRACTSNHAPRHPSTSLLGPRTSPHILLRSNWIRSANWNRYRSSTCTTGTMSFVTKRMLSTLIPPKVPLAGLINWSSLLTEYRRLPLPAYVALIIRSFSSSLPTHDSTTVVAPAKQYRRPPFHTHRTRIARETTEYKVDRLTGSRALAQHRTPYACSGL
jgi:hypothetical protein